MNLTKLAALLLTGAIALSGAAKKKTAVANPADSPRAFTQLLWPQGAPHPKVISPERQPVNIGDTAKIHVFLPAPSKANGKAVVLCPGGSYLSLCMDYEGTEWAEFFNNEGVALVVLQYRLPEGHWQIPVEDVQEAIRLTRRNAAAWHVDPAKVGVGGSSAGGHLASTASTHFKTPVNPDEVSCRPDFSILYYPVISFTPQITHRDTRRCFLGSDISPADEVFFSNETQVTPETPRTWMAYSHDDNLVPTIHGLRYYEALRNAGVPTGFYIYPTGGHGWGIRPWAHFPYHDAMLSDLSAWLKSF